MRRLLGLTISAALCFLIYLYHSDVQKNRQRQTPVTGTMVPPAPSPALIMRPQVTVHAAIHEKRERSVLKENRNILRVKHKKTRQLSSLPPAPRLQPIAPGDERSRSALVASARAPSAYQQRNVADPMQDRWVSELSGRKAVLTLGKSAVERDCQKTSAGCDAVHREARIFGVVLESERVVKTPTSAVDGQLTRGHYLHGTPALYLK